MKKLIFTLIMVLVVGAGVKVEGATVHQLAAGADLYTTYNSVGFTSGDIIELTTSGGTYTWGTKISNLTKSLTIRAATGLATRPVLELPAGVMLTGNNNAVAYTLIFKDIDFNGNAVSTGIAGSGKTVPGGDWIVTMDNCIVRNMATTAIIFTYSATGTGWTSSYGDLNVSNTQFIGSFATVFIHGGALNAGPLNAYYTNCFFKNITGSVIGNLGNVTNTTIDHCTFDGCASTTARYEVSLKANGSPVNIIKNTLFANRGASTAANIFGNGNAANTKNAVYYTGGGVVGTIYPTATLGDYVTAGYNVDPVINGTTYIATTSTYLNAGTDGKTIGYYGAAVAATPTISSSGTLSAVNTTYGTASASPTSFNVSGADMNAGILVTPPAGYEVSLSSGSGYAATVTVGSSGTIASTAVYVRLKADAAVGSYSGNIVLSSTDATSVNVATVSSTVSAATASISGGNLSAAGLTDAQLANTDVTVSEGVLVVDAGKTVRSITVNGGAQLSVADNQTLTLTNLTLKSDATNGTSTYVPTGDNKTGVVTVTGTTAVEQYLATTRNWYVSSPVSNANAPAGYTYYSRYEPGGTETGWTSVSVGAPLVAGKGYIALPGTAGLPITFTTQSGGSLNNGTVNIPLTYTPSATSGKGYNLIGNPYPSHLSWTYEFTQANASKIESTIWYRTNSGSSNVGGWSFVTFNPTSAETVPSTANGGIIPPMQAFWVLAKNIVDNSIQFSNSMRSHRTGNPLKVPAANNSERKKVRLQLSNGTNSDEALILFDTNASNNYDAYDSPKMMNNSADIADIYTISDDKKLVINGLNSVSNNMLLPLGYNAGAEGNLTLKVNELSNFDGDTRIYLVDGSTETELTQGTEYSFSTDKISGNDSRFSLLFRAPGTSTGYDSNEKLNAQVYVNATNQITIIAPEKASYSIYNAVGMLVENGKATGKLQTINSRLITGMYIVKVANRSTRVIIR